jgi:hypothetical protein
MNKNIAVTAYIELVPKHARASITGNLKSCKSWLYSR